MSFFDCVRLPVASRRRHFPLREGGVSTETVFSLGRVTFLQKIIRHPRCLPCGLKLCTALATPRCCGVMYIMCNLPLRLPACSICFSM